VGKWITKGPESKRHRKVPERKKKRGRNNMKGRGTVWYESARNQLEVGRDRTENDEDQEAPAKNNIMLEWPLRKLVGESNPFREAFT